MAAEFHVGEMPGWQNRPLAARWFVQRQNSHSILARCYSLENADFVCRALNAYVAFDRYADEGPCIGG